MFGQNPGVQVAVTHDNDWIRMLSRVLVIYEACACLLIDMHPGIVARISDRGKPPPGVYSGRTPVGLGFRT